MKDPINNAYTALDWWRTSSAKEKEKAVKQWKAQTTDYRKTWDVKRVGLSDSCMIFLYEKFVGN